VTAGPAPIVGVGGVVVHDGKVLLVRRGKPPFLGRWLIPGGTLELGETLEQAVVRELFEETAVRVEPGELLAVVDEIGREGDRIGHHFVIVDFLCRRLSGEPRAGSDALAAAWVAEDELPAYDLPARALAVVRDAFRRSAAPARGSVG
jgi:8-oxo-dGTP diphosphatase